MSVSFEKINNSTSTTEWGAMPTFKRCVPNVRFGWLAEQAMPIGGTLASSVSFAAHFQPRTGIRRMALTRRATTLALTLLAALWLISNLSVLTLRTAAGLRDPAIQLSGMLAISAAAIGLVLALRSRMPERAFGGLDKVYRSHRAFGIAALVFAVTHWVGTVRLTALWFVSDPASPVWAEAVPLCTEHPPIKSGTSADYSTFE